MCVLGTDFEKSAFQTTVCPNCQPKSQSDGSAIVSKWVAVLNVRALPGLPCQATFSCGGLTSANHSCIRSFFGACFGGVDVKYGLTRMHARDIIQEGGIIGGQMSRLQGL